MPDDYALIALFVKARDAAEVREALKLPADLRAGEAEFLRACSVVFDHLGKAGPDVQPVSHYSAAWVDRFNQVIHDFGKVLERVSSPPG